MNKNIKTVESNKTDSIFEDEDEDNYLEEVLQETENALVPLQNYDKHVDDRIQYRKGFYALKLTKQTASLLSALLSLTSHTSRSYEQSKSIRSRGKKKFDSRLLPIVNLYKPPEVLAPSSIFSEETANEKKSSQRGNKVASKQDTSKADDELSTTSSIQHSSPVKLLVQISQGDYTPYLGGSKQTTIQYNNLKDVINEERRLSLKNVSKWTVQLLGTLISFHYSYICLGDFAVTDFHLMPDIRVLRELLASNALSKEIKDLKFKNRLKSQGYGMDDEVVTASVSKTVNARDAKKQAKLRKQLEDQREKLATADKAEFDSKRLSRDVWFDPHRWLYAAMHGSRHPPGSPPVASGRMSPTRRTAVGSASSESSPRTISLLKKYDGQTKTGTCSIR